MAELVDELRAYVTGLIAAAEKKSAQLNELHRELADLRRRINSANELLELETGESVDAGLAAPIPIRSTTSQFVAVPQANTSSGAQLADAAAAVLLEHKQPMHYRAIAKAIADGGVAIGGRDPANNVNAAMTRDPRFYRPRRGTYYLRELAKGPIRHVGTRHKKGA